MKAGELSHLLRWAFEIERARDSVLWTRGSDGKFSHRELSKEDLEWLEKLDQVSLTIKEQSRSSLLTTMAPPTTSK